MAAVEPELAFLEVEVEQVFTNTAAFGQPGFGRAPEALNAVDVDATASGEDVVSVVDPMVFPVAEVHQSIIASPGVGVYDASDIDLPTENGLQGAFFGIRDDLRVHLTIALEDAEDDGLAARAAAAFALDALGAEVRFIHLHDTTESRLSFAVGSNLPSEKHEVSVDRVAVEPRDPGHLGGLKIKSEEADDLPKLTLRNVCTDGVSILACHYWLG